VWKTTYAGRMGRGEVKELQTKACKERHMQIFSGKQEQRETTHLRLVTRKRVFNLFSSGSI